MKWLAIRFSAIGDCVMTAHAVSRLRRADPDSHIAWCVEKFCEEVVDLERLCNARYTTHRARWRQQKWSPRVWREQLAYYSGLRRERFDYGLDFQGHLKTAICLRLAKPTKRLAIRGTDALAKRLNPIAAKPDRPMHCVDAALYFLDQVLKSNESFEPIMPKLEAERQRIRETVRNERPLATIAVNAGQEDKSYPIESWREVAESLLSHGFNVAFIGGKESKAPKVPGALDWVGKCSLSDSMAAIAESSIHLAGDTGAGHIAAAYSTPVLSVFGPTDPAIFRPFTDRGIVLREGRSTDLVEPKRVIDAALELHEKYGQKISH